MVMVVMAATASDGLSEILQIGKLAALGGVGEICRKLAQLAGRARVALRLSRLSGALQIGGDLLRHLLVLGGVRLLKLLQRADQLSKWRKLSAVGLRRGRYAARAARASGDATALKRADKDLLQIRTGKAADGAGTHDTLIGLPVAGSSGNLHRCRALYIGLCPLFLSLFADGFGIAYFGL